jgi:predicted RNA-binding protein Jag
MERETRKKLLQEARELRSVFFRYPRETHKIITPNCSEYYLSQCTGLPVLLYREKYLHTLDVVPTEISLPSLNNLIERLVNDLLQEPLYKDYSREFLISRIILNPCVDHGSDGFTCAEINICIYEKETLQHYCNRLRNFYDGLIKNMRQELEVKRTEYTNDVLNKLYVARHNSLDGYAIGECLDQLSAIVNAFHNDHNGEYNELEMIAQAKKFLEKST